MIPSFLFGPNSGRCGAPPDGRSVRWILAAVVAFACALASAAPARAGWNAPIAISARGEIGPVRLAVDARGDAIAVWSRVTRPWNARRPDQGYAVEAAFRGAGGAWQPPVVVGAAVQLCPRGTCGWPVPSLAIGPRGAAVIAWANFTTSGAGVIRAASRAADGRWQRPVAVYRGGATWLQVALDQLGNATAIWSPGGPRGAIRVAFQPAGKQWRKPPTIGSGFGVQLAFDAKGNAIALWTHLISDRRGALEQAAFKPARGSWSQPVTIGRGGGGGYLPQLAVDPRGDAIAVWADWVRPGVCCGSAVQAASKPAGGLWRTPVTIASGFVGSVQVGLDARGDALAIWDLARGDVQAAMASPQGSWQRPISLGAGAPPQLRGVAGEVDAALDSQGNAVAVWIHDLGTSHDPDHAESLVQAATFTRAG